MAKIKGPTAPCPVCDGEGVTKVSYTDPPITCPNCDGAGVVPADEGAEAAQDVSDEGTAIPAKTDTDG